MKIFLGPVRPFFMLIFLCCCVGGAIAEPVRVVATTSILMDLTRNVGGGDVRIVTLVPPDGDAHVYEPRPADAQAIAGAQLVVENGLGLEPWLPRLIGAAAYKGSQTIASAGIKSLSVAHGTKETIDPHAWQDLANGRIYVQNIARALADLDPPHADAYRRRAALYDAALRDLDQKIRRDLAKVPAQKRRVITSHDAFQYYGKAYEIEFIAPLGLSTEESEPSAVTLARLENQIRAGHIRALFLETMTDRRLVDQLAQDTGTVAGPALYSDALSKPGGPAPTYSRMFTYNTAALVAGMLQN